MPITRRRRTREDFTEYEDRMKGLSTRRRRTKKKRRTDADRYDEEEEGIGTSIKTDPMKPDGHDTKNDR